MRKLGSPPAALRWLAALALLVAAVALAGCGSSGSSSSSGSTESSGSTTAGEEVKEETTEEPAEETSEEPAEEAGEGELAAYDPSAPAGPETGLDKRVAWANTSSAEFFLSLGDAISEGAKAEGCDYTTAVAEDDAQKNVEQMNQFIARGIGAMVVQPLDPASQTPVMEKALGEGIGVMGLTNAPTTMVAQTAQYKVGFEQGKAAAEYVTAELGGEAEVQVFNEDSLGPPLKERHEGMLAGLETGGPGIKVVSDVEAKKLTIEGGFETMNTVIQAHPGIKVVLGVDTEVLGALRALEQSGKASEDMYLSGIDGEPQALEQIKKGGPYKASWAFAWPVLGYTMGTYSCQWIAGKSIPKALVVPAVNLDSVASIETYEKDMSEPAEVFNTPSRIATYIEPLGNISYEEKENYWKEPFTP
jgi:ribose transport system substrate-binding protein